MRGAEEKLDPRQKMVTEQIVARGIHDARVIAAMEWLPRERFMPADVQSHAYDDAAVPIGHGQTISQPYMVALMSQELQLRPEHKVLEIGTGSGYQTAVLANLVTQVCTIERIKPLLDETWERLTTLGLRNIKYNFGDGSLGWSKHAPYDRIIVTAGAPHAPEELMKQLVEGGLCLVPVGDGQDQQLLRFTRTGNTFTKESLCGCRFVPLIGKDGWGEERG